jgi:hypothetical protein
VLEQGEGQFRLGLEGDVVGNATRGAVFNMSVVKPRFWQEDTAIGQGRAVATGVPQEDSNLRIGDFAHRSTILRSDAHGGAALL